VNTWKRINAIETGAVALEGVSFRQLDTSPFVELDLLVPSMSSRILCALLSSEEDNGALGAATISSFLSAHSGVLFIGLGLTEALFLGAFGGIISESVNIARKKVSIGLDGGKGEVVQDIEV